MVCFQEGIRFEMVENASQVMRQDAELYVACFGAPIALNIGSYKLMDYLEDKGSLNEKSNLNAVYDLESNNCLHFVDGFGQRFKPEIFHREKRMTTFNTGIDRKSNVELLEWTLSVIKSK